LLIYSTFVEAVSLHPVFGPGIADVGRFYKVVIRHHHADSLTH